MKRLVPYLDGLQSWLPCAKTLNSWVRLMWDISSGLSLSLSQVDFLIRIWARDRKKKGIRANICWLSLVCYDLELSSNAIFHLILTIALRGIIFIPIEWIPNAQNFKNHGQFTQLRTAFTPNRTSHIKPVIFPELWSYVVDDISAWCWWYEHW